MTDSNSDPQSNDMPSGVQDDFSSAQDLKPEERRLHMQAFDYWLKLKAERAFPLFSELRAEDLAPFKSNSLLVEFNQSGTVVRFIGSDISNLVDAPLVVGSQLADFADSAFANALLDQFADENIRAKAAEFEFVEETRSCRGIMLPFSRDGDDAHFVMVVASFRMEAPSEVAVSDEPQARPDEGPAEEAPQAASADVDALNEVLADSREAADTIVHMDSGNRASLYDALARALALYESARDNRAAYETLLKGAGLKEQARAPYTPVLKLVFGTDYDKTRLTEYAAAISFAVRNGETSETLTDFLIAMPGGIKGCVQAERAFKRQEAGTPAHNRQVEAEEILRHAPAVPLKDIDPNDEFCLILARRASGGGVEVLGCPDVSKATVDAAVRHLASPMKDK